MTARNVFRALDITLFDVEEIPTHGGSLRIFGSHAEDDTYKVSFRVEALLRREEESGFDRLGTYFGFDEKVRATKRKLLKFLIEAKEAGKTVVGYGASGKGNTLLNYCGIGTDFLDYTVDRNTDKHGKFTSGNRIPIFHPAKVRETQSYYILGTSKNPQFCLNTRLSRFENLGWPWKQRVRSGLSGGGEACASPFASTSGLLSLRWSGEEQKSLEVIREILQPNLEASSHEPDGSNPFAAHRGDLMAEDMFDTRSNARAALVVGLLLSGQRFIAIAFALNLGAQACRVQMGFDRVGAIGGVGPDIPSGLCGHQDCFQHLTLMDRRIGDRILPNELVRLIHVHLVCVPIMILTMLHGPAGLGVFLPPLGGRTLPLRRACASFDRGMFVVRVVWLGYGDQRGINQLAATRL